MWPRRYKHVGQLTGLTRPVRAAVAAPPASAAAAPAPDVQRSNTSVGIGAYAAAAVNAAVADIARSASARTRGGGASNEPIVSTRKSYRRALLPEFYAPPVRDVGSGSSQGSGRSGSPSGAGDSTASPLSGGDSVRSSMHKAPTRPRGLLVCFSFAFREGVDLRPDAFSPEGLTPSKVFQ